MYDLLIKSGKNVRKGGYVTNVLNEYKGLDKAVKKAIIKMSYQ